MELVTKVLRRMIRLSDRVEVVEVIHNNAELVSGKIKTKSYIICEEYRLFSSGAKLIILTRSHS